MAHFLKNFILVLLFSVSTCLLCVQKLSVLYLVTLVKENFYTVSRYLIRVWLLFLPQLLSFLQILWNVPILARSNHPLLPPLRKLAVDILICVLEAACLVVLTEIVTFSLPAEVLLLVSAPLILAIPLARDLISNVKEIAGDHRKMTSEPMKRSYLQNIRRTLVMSVTNTFVTTAMCLYISGSMDFAGICVFTLALVVLGFTWSRCLDASQNEKSRYESAGRVHYLYAIVKLVSIIIFVSFVSLLHDHKLQIDLNDILEEVLEASNEVKYLLILLILSLIFSSLFYKVTTFIAMSFCQPKVGLYIPSFASLFGSFMVMSLLNLIDSEHISDFHNSLGNSFTAFFLAVASTNVVIVCLVGRRIFTSDPRVLLASHNQLFNTFGWNFLFLDVETIMSAYTKCKMAVTSDAGRLNVKSSPVIFVCPTMFREEAWEMSTMLTSLKKLTETRSQLMPDARIYLHVFFDNGCEGDKPTFHAEQLLLLLKRDQLKDCILYRTPYGLQCQCMFSNSTPFTIHLKDNKKFKNKKRWSQAMYMQYILNFWLKKHSSDISGQDVYNIQHENKDYSLNKGCNHNEASQLHPLEVVREVPTSNGYHTLGNVPRNAATWLKMLASPKGGDVGDEEIRDLFRFKQNLPQLNGHAQNGKLEPHHARSNGIHKNNNVKHGYSLNSAVATKGVDGSFSSDLHANPDNTFILALDGDVHFEPAAVWELYHQCAADKTVGAVCGRTHATALTYTSPTVWYQKLEYSNDFWSLKALQNVIGSVTCCPGCFSMFRASALKDVVNKLCEPTISAADVYLKDIGEDRWITSRLILSGWNTKYAFLADNQTHCPAQFAEFMRQRKRWVISDLVNDVALLGKSLQLVRVNPSATGAFIALLGLLLVCKLHLTGSTIFIMASAFHIMFDVSITHSALLLSFLMAVFVISCLMTSGTTQVRIVMIYCIVFGVVFAVDIFYLCYLAYGTAILYWDFEDTLSMLLIPPTVLSTLALVYAALLHPWDFSYLLYWPVYVLYSPAAMVFLPLYSICSIGDQRWGTRDGTGDEDDVLCRVSCLKCSNTEEESMMQVDQNNTEDVAGEDTEGTKLSINPTNMADVPDLAPEVMFWNQLGQTILGADVNKGTNPEVLNEKLACARIWCLCLYLCTNAAMLLLSIHMFSPDNSNDDSTTSYSSYFYITFMVVATGKIFLPVLGMTINHMYTLMDKTASAVFEGANGS